MSKVYCLWSAHYAPHKGGIENYTERLAGALAEQGDRVVVVTSNLCGSAPVEAQDNGVEVYRLPCYPLMAGRLPIPRRNVEYRALIDRLHDTKFDGVLVNARFYGHSLQGMRFARRQGLKPLVLDHGSAYLTLGNAVLDGALAAYEHGITAVGKRYDPAYYGVSHASAKWLETFGIQAQGVLPNAIDAAAFRESASLRNYRSDLGLHESDKLIAFVGRIAPEKGASQLVEAARLVESDGIHFAMAGQGPLLEQLKIAAPSNVHFLGTLEEPDVSALFGQSDAFCLPSRSEGFCTALLESASWGCPSIITHVGGTDELVLDSRYGVILPSSEPSAISEGLLRGLAADCGRVERRALIISHVESKFGWSYTAETLRKAFSAAAQERSGIAG